MRPDSKRITTRELSNGTIEICADLSGFAQTEFGLEPSVDRWGERAGWKARLWVRPDLSVVADTPGELWDLRFVGRRSLVSSLAPQPHPLEFLAYVRQPDLPVLNTPREQWQAGQDARKKAHVQTLIRTRYLRRLWNGMLRRALAFVDPDVVRLTNAVGGGVALYNALALGQDVYRLVTESRAVGACFGTSRPIVDAEWAGCSVAEALQRLLPHSVISPALVAYATKQRFTRWYTPGTMGHPKGLVMTASELLQACAPEWLDKLTAPRHWAFLHLLMSPYLNHIDQGRLVWVYLGGDPQEMIDVVDTYFAPERYADKHRTFRRHRVLEELSRTAPERITTIRDWATLSRTYGVLRKLTTPEPELEFAC